MAEPTDGGIATLPFPPITKAHIMNCSYHSWHPKYAKHCVKVTCECVNTDEL